MSYLLRLVVPDRPGILGAVASALGEAGVPQRPDRGAAGRGAAGRNSASRGAAGRGAAGRGRRGADVLAASEAAPAFEAVALPWLPLTSPRLLPSEEDWLPRRWRETAVEMMAAPDGDPSTALVLGRTGGPSFRRSELLRLVHLGGIAAAVAHLPPA